jgi:predicted dehydrogenase
MSAARAPDALRVALVGCGKIGRKRALALASDALVSCYDSRHDAAQSLAAEVGITPAQTLEDLLELQPEVVIVSTSNDALAEVAVKALAAGAHVLVEKPGARSVRELDEIAERAASSSRLVKVGFNHRFHPGIARVATEVLSGVHGDVMFLRGRYGHGGRLGYEREWRADPEISGGGELMDQGMHLLDLSYWLVGALPLHSALLRTNFWEMPVEDNALLILGEREASRGPWSTLHASWTEWKNEFALDVYCRTAKLQSTGLWGSYGPQHLSIYRMQPELGPPHAEEMHFGLEDHSWEAEWQHFRAVLKGSGDALLGDLDSARYGLAIVQSAYRMSASLVTGER